MCLAIPGRVVAIAEGTGFDRRGTVDYDGVRQEVALAYLPEVQVGDYVIVHVGHAIGILDPEEAQKTLALFAQLQAETGPASGEGESGEPHAEGRVGAETLR